MNILLLILAIILSVFGCIVWLYFILSYVVMVRKIDEIYEKLGCTTEQAEEILKGALKSVNADIAPILNMKRINTWVKHAKDEPKALKYSHRELIQAIQLAYEKGKPEWISVKDGLPKEHLLGMSKEVLTLAGSKINVKVYDYELKRWSGSPDITVKFWMPLPDKPRD